MLYPIHTYVSRMMWGVQPEGQANLNKADMARQQTSVRWHKSARYVNTVSITASVKPSLSVPQRHPGGVEVQRHLFLTLTPDTGERSTSHPQLIYLWGQKPLVPTEWKSHLATGWVWKFWANYIYKCREIIMLLCKWDLNTNRPTSSLYWRVWHVYT
jgi:hypothetical protein